MADKNPIITVDLNMFSQDAEAKTTEANKVAKSLDISDEALAKVEDFKQALTEHNAWDLPFMGYVNEDGYGYAYVPDAAITMNPYWDAHKEFMNLPEDVQTAFAIRMLFTHRPVDRYGAGYVPALPPWLPSELHRLRRQQVLIGIARIVLAHKTIPKQTAQTTRWFAHISDICANHLHRLISRRYSLLTVRIGTRIKTVDIQTI